MMRDARWYRFYYIYQYMLSQDRWYMETISETREGTGNGVRQESSLPFTLNTLASQMTDIECDDELLILSEDDYMETEAYYKWQTYKIAPMVQKQRREDANIMVVQETDTNTYHQALNQLPANLRAMLDEHVQADKYYLVRQQGMITGGFATNTTGYLTGLFSLKKGNGKKIFNLRLQQAKIDSDSTCDKLTIFCTGEFLKDFYKEYGFRVDRAVTWNPEFAPDNWDYQKFGTPKLYWMSRHINYGVKL